MVFGCGVNSNSCSSGERGQKRSNTIGNAERQAIGIADQELAVRRVGQIGHFDDCLGYARRDGVTVAPRIERVVIPHAQTDVLVVARQLGVGGVDLIDSVNQLIVDRGNRAEPRACDLEAARVATGIPVSVDGDEGIRLIAWRDRGGQHVDLDAAGLEQPSGALGNVQVDLPLLFATADRAALQPAKLRGHLIVLPMASLEPDPFRPWRVV